MSEIPRYEENVDKWNDILNDKSLTPEEEQAFLEAQENVRKAQELWDTEHDESSKDADRLMSSLTEDWDNDLDWAKEDASAKEKVFNDLRNWKINEQTIVDLNYSLPQNRLKQGEFANEVRANISNENFSKLKSVFDNMLKEINDINLKTMRDNPDMGHVLVWTEYYELYETLFGVTPDINF